MTQGQPATLAQLTMITEKAQLLIVTSNSVKMRQCGTTLKYKCHICKNMAFDTIKNG